MSIKACIFDLGNTLMSIPREFDEEECLAQLLGTEGTDPIRTVIYRLCDRRPGQSIDEFLCAFDSAYNASGDEDLRAQIYGAWRTSVEKAILSPGALEVLDNLSGRGLLLGLVSNTPPTSHDIVDRLQLRDRFSAVTFSCDCGFLKPDPRIFKCSLDSLGVLASETVVIGDKVRTDILGGAILGMRSILLEVRMRSIVEDGRSYVDAIVPTLLDIFDTRLYKEEMS